MNLVIMKRITPIQGLTLFFLIGLFFLVLFFRNDLPLWRSLIFRYTVWIGLLFALKLASERGSGRLGALFNDFSPGLFVILIYQSLGDLIQYLHPDIDSMLIRIDFFLLGVHPTVWMERWTVPWLTDLLSLAYASYYFFPVVLAIALYLKNPKRDFEVAMFVLLLGYYVSFIGYILFPAIGPRHTLTHLQTVPLEGSVITDFIRDTLNSWEHNKRDCMPSGHTQVALMVLFLSYRYRRLLFYFLLPVVSGLILSTVYHRYHYVIDLFAGAFLAVACVIIGPRLYKAWTRRIDSRAMKTEDQVQTKF
jgi:membrane-associated phospholipid phosphatase